MLTFYQDELFRKIWTSSFSVFYKLTLSSGKEFWKRQCHIAFCGGQPLSIWEGIHLEWSWFYCHFVAISRSLIACEQALQFTLPRFIIIIIIIFYLFIYFQFLVLTTKEKSVDSAGKSAFKLVNLRNLKVICWKLTRYSSSKSWKFYSWRLF